MTDRLDHMMAELENQFALHSDNERLRYINALVVIADAAKNAGYSKAMKRLTTLARALNDLGQGRLDPLLAPAKTKGGRLPDGGEVWTQRVHVLLAIEALTRSGMKSHRAAKHIAQNFPGLQRLMSRGQKLAQAIIAWRRDLNEALPTSHLAEFAKLLIDGENEMNKLGEHSPQRWRHYADNLCERLLT
jgi:hypothetical protein